MSAVDHALLVKQAALALGFDSVGITDLSPVPHGDVLTDWLAAGMAGTMAYMHRQAARRRKPAAILPGATHAVIVTKGHYAPDSPSRSDRGRVAKYARGPDYHRVLAEPLEQLARYVATLGGDNTITRWYVDAGPVPERELAQRAGLGWIGKNTMLIHPHHGSFFFIASVLTSLELAVDAPFDADRCGTCHRCLDACPTRAFSQPRVLDSRRCISYLTIEHRGQVPVSLERSLGQWVFGCDVCQDVCPWNNKFARASSDPRMENCASLELLELEALLTMSEEQFSERYAKTALMRTGLDGMRRNAKIAIQNRDASSPGGSRSG